jgi:hypothetical protein
MTQAVDDQQRVGGVALELLVLANGRELFSGAVELEVPVELAVRLEQYDIERLDAAVLLHAAGEADGIVEHFQAALLAAANRRAPTDDQYLIGHSISFWSWPDPVPGRSSTLACSGGGSQVTIGAWTAGAAWLD